MNLYKAIAHVEKFAGVFFAVAAVAAAAVVVRLVISVRSIKMCKSRDEKCNKHRLNIAKHAHKTPE